MSAASKKRSKTDTAPPASKAQSEEKWSFINLSEPKQSKDKSLRHFVRSNAMRDYRQKKRQDQIRHHGGPVDTTTVQGVDQSPSSPKPTRPTPVQDSDNGDAFQTCGHEECPSDCRYTSHQSLARPKQLLGDGGIDPFDTLPIGGDSRYNCYVLNHFNAVIARNFLPVKTDRGQHPLTDVWMPHAVADPLLFLATLNFAAAHLDIIRGRHTSPRTIAQKVETIRLINLRLKDSTENLSNTTIGAVAMLAAMESTSGNHHDLNVHMDALEKMVRMRGGLQQLGWDGVLQTFISWQDLHTSAMLSAPPHFPRPSKRLIIQGGIPLSTPICPQMEDSLELCAEMINNYNDMRQLADLLSSFDHPITPMERMHLDSVRNSLKHRFLSVNIRKPKKQMQSLDYLLEACRIAALIFLNRAFHNYWPSCAIIRELRCQLKELLLEKESHITIEVSPQEQWGYYAWAFFIGGIHSQKEEDIAFFAKRIAISTRVWQDKGFTDWRKILHLIKRVGWIGALQSLECDALGKQVESFIGSEDARDLAPEPSAHTCCPSEFNTLVTAWSPGATVDVVCCSSPLEQRPHVLPLLFSKFV